MISSSSAPIVNQNPPSNMTSMNQARLLGASMGSVAIDASHDIKLTKYNSLNSESSSGVLTSHESNQENYLSANEKQQEVDSVKSLPALKLDHLSNKLWTIAQHHGYQDINQPPFVAQDPINAKSIGNREPFQVVWTKLAFEVDLSTYDKLVNKALSCARYICSFGNGGQLQIQREQQNQGIRSQKTIDLNGQSFDSSLSRSTTDGAQLVGGVTTNPTDKRVIFENLNGYINSGELSAILGPSGSGKTSLLNAICGRTENYSGSIQLIGGGHQRMRLSIIPQKDYLIENLSVRENLLYSSKILNPQKKFDHESNIMRVVKMLNLGCILNSIAANISGGEYKRLSIAQELLRQPDILILDEPTSGLDSLNCKNLIHSLNQLIDASRQGLLKPIAIVMTIHQPDIDVFHMFDHVYCMARGGRVIYDGHPKDTMRVIRSYAKLGIDQTHSHPGNNSETASNHSSGSNPSSSNSQHATINPANLLIEIASKDLYGQAPIEKLARYQFDQFEQLFEIDSHCSTSLDSQQQKNNMSQLQANLQLTNNNLLQKIKNTTLEANNNNHMERTPSISLISTKDQHYHQRSSLVSSFSYLSANNSVVSSTHSGNSYLTRDKRLNVKNDLTGRFWYHTKVLAQRQFVDTLRNPLMTLISLIFHLSIPFVMWTVYPKRIGTTHACPVIQRDLDIVSMASNRIVSKLEDLQEQITTTLECSTMWFLVVYSFSMCSLSVSALAFPIDMHVVLKEYRNGWYNLSSYVLGKTIANFPFEVIFPVISLVMIYVMLDMPSSYFEWRMWAMALTLSLVSMISHAQGLIFGALLMDNVSSAVFLASASSLPNVMLSGFTARLRYMPAVLQKLSWISQYRYSTELTHMIRFGFGICPCEQKTEEYLRTRQPDFTDVPPQTRPVFIYYLVNNSPTVDNSSQVTTTSETLLPANAAITPTTFGSSIENVTTTANTALLSSQDRVPGVDYELMLNQHERRELLTRMESGEVDLFGRMAEMMSRSFSFGRKLDGCNSVRSQILITGGSPPDDYLPLLLGCMFGLLLACKLILFLCVRWKIGSRA